MSESSPNAGHEDALFENPSPAPAEPTRPGRWWRIIVGINIAVYVGMVLTGTAPLDPSVQALIKWGANVGPLSMSSEPWRLVTSMFLHVGLIHIFFNMNCLIQLGPAAEVLFGSRRFLVLYLLSGLGGSIASIAWNPTTVGAGASGAIFGIVGGLIGFMLRKKDQLAPNVFKSQLNNMLSFVGINLFIGFAIPHIDNSAHIGGLVTGFLLGFFSLEADRSFTGKSRMQEWIAAAFIVAALAGCAVYAHQGATSKSAFASTQHLTMEEMKVGNTTFNYDSSISKELVTKFDEAWKVLPDAAGSKVTILLFKASDRVELGFIANPDSKAKADLFKGLALYFSKNVFDDKPVDIRFFDPHLNELRTIRWEESVASGAPETIK